LDVYSAPSLFVPHNNKPGFTFIDVYPDDNRSYAKLIMHNTYNTSNPEFEYYLLKRSWVPDTIVSTCADIAAKDKKWADEANKTKKSLLGNLLDNLQKSVEWREELNKETANKVIAGIVDSNLERILKEIEDIGKKKTLIVQNRNDWDYMIHLNGNKKIRVVSYEDIRYWKQIYVTEQSSKNNFYTGPLSRSELDMTRLLRIQHSDYEAPENKANLVDIVKNMMQKDGWKIIVVSQDEEEKQGERIPVNDFGIVGDEDKELAVYHFRDKNKSKGHQSLIISFDEDKISEARESWKILEKLDGSWKSYESEEPFEEWLDRKSNQSK
jgi:hypothetical protein